eukprot:TRINITY_DN52906_c0_g1_i1.p2 TRINITY_DN52906_c0_g1~~TRINITY_DN52906_c0_g1_i1.p2  ORF type:complete len:175 (-),score=57.22 TRINITY_DN52906_c0_g1_i1:88-612(-)
MLDKVNNISQKIDTILKKYALLEMEYKNLEAKLNSSLEKENVLNNALEDKNTEIEKLKNNLTSSKFLYEEERKKGEEKEKFYSSKIEEYNVKIEDSIKKIDEIYSLMEKIQQMKKPAVKQFLIAGTYVNICLPTQEEEQKSAEVLANVTNKLNHYKKEYSIENNTTLILSLIHI